MKKFVSALVAVTVLSLGAAFAQETGKTTEKPAEKAAAGAPESSKAPEAKKETSHKKKSSKKHHEGDKKAEGEKKAEEAAKPAEVAPAK